MEEENSVAIGGYSSAGLLFIYLFNVIQGYYSDICRWTTLNFWIRNLLESFNRNKVLQGDGRCWNSFEVEVGEFHRSNIKYNNPS